MWEFIQSYGVWILFGVFFLFMMRSHGHGSHGGGGCGMGGHGHSEPPKEWETSSEVQETTDGNPRGSCH